MEIRSKEGKTMPHINCSYLTVFAIALLIISANVATSTSVQDSTTSSPSVPLSSPIPDADNHEEYQQQQYFDNNEQSSSFVTKIGNGFERLVVSIDNRLALLSQSLPSAPENSSTSSSPERQHACRTILEQLTELMSRTSDYLHKVTKGQTYFRQVSILLPPSWANVNCTGTYQRSSRFLFPAEELLTTSSVSPSAVHHAQSTADIHVTPDHPVYIDRPWTLQYGGCGVPGRKISIPVSFLTTAGNQAALKARLLVREWIKYRYGVFDETGFALDEKYPSEYIGPNGAHQPTACFLNRTNCGSLDECKISNDQNRSSQTAAASESTTKDDVSAKKLIDPYALEDDNLRRDPKASLMSLPSDNQADELCDEHTHVRTTPTKHNFLCDGKSIWEVMREHADFKNVQKISKPSNNLERNGHGQHTAPEDPAPSTSISYVTAKASRIVFLLDRTQVMKQNNRWTNLRRAMYRMFHHVPAGVELGVITYTNVSTVSLPLTVASTHNRDHLHGRVPVRPLTTLPEDACLSCSLRMAIKLLKGKDDSTDPATIVLITASSNFPTREWQDISKLVETNPLRVIVVTYDSGVKSGQFAELAKYGELIRISDNDSSSGSPNLEQSVVLNNVFLKIFNEHLGSPVYKIHESIEWPNTEWLARGKFIIEESLGRNTWVTVTPEEHGDVDGLQLQSPSGKLFDLSLNAEGMTFLRIPEPAEHGRWSYIVKYYQNQEPRPVSVDVVTEGTKSEAISVRFWNTVRRPTEDNIEVVLLYAEILQGDLPVLNANVTVMIKLPGEQPHHESKTIKVHLLDNGSSDPDITWGDGIYSAYFTQLGSIPGVFGVSIHVSDNNGRAVIPIHTNITRGSFDKPCCGSSIPHIATVPINPFNRYEVGSAFVIYNGLPHNEDPYPPGRVTDLHIERVVDSASEIKLSWTAPGGDYDKGKAATYEIRCYTSRDALTNDNFSTQGILVHASITPQPESYGVHQSCVVAVPWENDYFYYGIVAIDGALNRGKVSNLVSAFIKESPKPTMKITDAWHDDALVSNLTSARSQILQNQKSLENNNNGTSIAGATWFKGLNEIELYLVLAAAAACLLLMSILILAVVCVKRTTQDEKDSPPAYHSIYSSNDLKGKDVNEKILRGCCWENESTNSSISKNPTQHSKVRLVSELQMSNYIPASALYSSGDAAAKPHNNDQYNNIYSGSQLDSGSVTSKPSDGDSEATASVTYDSTCNPLLHGGEHHAPPPYYAMGLNGSVIYGTHNQSANSPYRHNVFSNKSSSSSGNGSVEILSSENDNLENYMHSQTSLHQQYNHNMSPTAGGVRDSGHYDYEEMGLPLPYSTPRKRECDAFNNTMRSYQGSLLSVQSYHGSQRKKMRHVSFV